MSHQVECTVSNADGEQIVDMHFAVHLREEGTPKLPKLYSNWATVGLDEKPALLPEEEVLEARTHEAEILNLDGLIRLFTSRGKSALLADLNTNCHLHRESADVPPYVCWASFTPTLEEMLPIVKAWTVLNAVNAISDGTIDANAVDNPLDLIEKCKLSVRLVVDGVEA
ncbi:MAG: hypothetical protein WC846_05280 [Candidatus Gracilibacteria bacterium]|jgi:hypothetical protein